MPRFKISAGTTFDIHSVPVWLKPGVSLKVIQEAAGHKTIVMSARYTHMDHTTLQNAMSVLNRSAGA